MADRDPDTAELLALCFERLGCESHAAITGADAIDIARHVKPDLAMLDVALTVRGGCDVVRELRSTNASDLFLVALTNLPERRELERIRHAGFDHHVLKPFGLDSIRRVMARSAWQRAESMSPV